MSTVGVGLADGDGLLVEDLPEEQVTELPSGERTQTICELVAGEDDGLGAGAGAELTVGTGAGVGCRTGRSATVDCVGIGVGAIAGLIAAGTRVTSRRTGVRTGTTVRRCTVRYTRCSVPPGCVTASPGPVVVLVLEAGEDVADAAAGVVVAGTMNAVTVTALVTMLSEARESRENENRGRVMRGAGVIAPALGTRIGSLIVERPPLATAGRVSRTPAATSHLSRWTRKVDLWWRVVKGEARVPWQGLPDVYHPATDGTEPLRIVSKCAALVRNQLSTIDRRFAISVAAQALSWAAKDRETIT